MQFCWRYAQFAYFGEKSVCWFLKWDTGWEKGNFKQVRQVRLFLWMHVQLKRCPTFKHHKHLYSSFLHLYFLHDFEDIFSSLTSIPYISQLLVFKLMESISECDLINLNNECLHLLIAAQSSQIRPLHHHIILSASSAPSSSAPPGLDSMGGTLFSTNPKDTKQLLI